MCYRKKDPFPWNKVSKDHFKEITRDITSKSGVDYSDVCTNAIIIFRIHGDHISPISLVENLLVDLIVQIKRIR